MHSFVTSKNAQWPRLIWPTLYIVLPFHGELKFLKNSTTEITKDRQYS